MTIQLHPRVLELVSSRICHDLVSPVGAISNGVELMQELGEEAGAEAMQLIAASALQASIRLKCFRLCYGAAGTDKNIGFKDVKDVFTDWLTSGHVQVEFEDDLGLKYSMPPRGFFKSILNLLLFAEECSHGEGKIFVSSLEGNKGMQILATGHHIGLRDGAEGALTGETAVEDLDARSVHAYVTARFIEYFGFHFSHQAQSDAGRLELKLSF